MTVAEYNKAVNNFSDNLYRYLLKSTQNKADADDLVQISFERLWLNRKKIINKKAKAYLFKVAYNAMIDNYRKIRRLHFSDIIPEKVEPSKATNFELQEVLHQALDKLNINQRSVLLLCDYEGYAYKEISTLTGLSLEQVKVYIFRARRKMRMLLKPYLNQSRNEQQYNFK